MVCMWGGQLPVVSQKGRSILTSRWCYGMTGQMMKQQSRSRMLIGLLGLHQCLIKDLKNSEVCGDV